jgi:hypothetical protein
MRTSTVLKSGRCLSFVSLCRVPEKVALLRQEKGGGKRKEREGCASTMINHFETLPAPRSLLNLLTITQR